MHEYHLEKFPSVFEGHLTCMNITWKNFLVNLEVTLYEYPSYAYSMATFSMVPYLTIVSTHGSVITPLEMQETNSTQCNG